MGLEPPASQPASAEPTKNLPGLCPAECWTSKNNCILPHQTCLKMAWQRHGCIRSAGCYSGRLLGCTHLVLVGPDQPWAVPTPARAGTPRLYPAPPHLSPTGSKSLVSCVMMNLHFVLKRNTNNGKEQNIVRDYSVRNAMLPCLCRCVAKGRETIRVHWYF